MKHPPPTSPATNTSADLRGSGLSASARNSARTRLSAIESSDEFDTLTDLFLGEVAPRSAAGGVTAPTTQAGVEAAPVDTSTIDEPSHPATHVHEPEAHKPEAREPANRTTVSVRPVDPRSTLVECVVIGHVPVLASAWASQYAREVARASGKSVAMLRLRGGGVSVEIVDDPSRTSEPDELAMEGDVRRAMQAASRLATRWIVHADAGLEAELAADPSVRLITLLTGADEAARVAGYGAVKRLSEVLPPSGEVGPLIRVATVGVGADKAAAAGQKIVEAVRHFLGREAQQAACTDKLRSVRAPRMLFMGDMTAAPTDILQMIGDRGDEEPVTQSQVESVNEVDVNSPSSSAQMTASASEDRHETTIAGPEIEHDDGPGVPAGVAQEVTDIFAAPRVEMSGSDEDREDVDAGASITMVGEKTDAMVDSPPAAYDSGWTDRDAGQDQLQPVQAPSVRAASTSRPQSERVQPEPRAARESGENSLASRLAGMSLLAARCPSARNVEIALDERGRVHVLADGRGAEWNVNQAVADLLVASAWVEEYAGMILRDQGVGGRAALHVFVDQPKHGRRLLDSALRVHLLMGVEVDGRRGDVCVELN